MSLPDVANTHLTGLLLVVARVGGLFVFAPLISTPAVPMRVKALLIFALSLAVYTVMSPTQGSGGLDLPALTLAVALESLVGVALGLLAAIPIYFAQLGGLLAAQQIGFGLGAVYNPALDTESDPIGDLFMYGAIATFLSLGGLNALVLALLRSFDHVQAGVPDVIAAPGAILSGLVSSGFELAIRVSAPVLAILLLETIASSLVMKTLPHLNFQSVGFAVKALAGIAAITGSIVAINRSVGDEMSLAMNAIGAWVTGTANH